VLRHRGGFPLSALEFAHNQTIQEIVLEVNFYNAVNFMRFTRCLMT
jgi:hypothetical protein